MKSLLLAARKIFQAGLSAIDPYKAVHNYVAVKNNVLALGSELQKSREYDLKKFRRVFVLGAGKASVPMAAACEEILQKRISKGIIVTKYGHSGPLKYITTVEAGHPVPDKAGLHAAQDILTLLKGSQSDDLVIFLTSGGCSALLPLPVSPITLSEKKKLTNLLLRSGAPIHEINAVRK
ncbi:MAG: glycerate-2-kinase family protein, partial [Deltaproteobacteria bacterium]|nr:glycerate-2-kinase family protein [Deltaproteobacteria bacterium]